MCFMIFKILKSNYEAMSDNYNISLSCTYGRSVVFSLPIKLTTKK